MKPLSLQQLHHYHCKTLFYSIHLRWELYAPTHAQISNPSLLLNSEIYIWMFLELFNRSMIQMWRILCNHVTSLINLCISFFHQSILDLNAAASFSEISEMRLKLKKLLVRIYLRAIGVVFSYRLSYRNIIFFEHTENIFFTCESFSFTL